MKKILLILTGLSVTTSLPLSVIGCTEPDLDPTENDPDYYIPPLSEQPKSIEEIEEAFVLKIDKNYEYLEMYEKELAKYKKEVGFDELTKEEQNKHKILFAHKSAIRQKRFIIYFWRTTYEYKFFQFNPKYNKELETPNGHKETIYAVDLDDYKYAFEERELKDEYSTDKTKEHIRKIFEWGKQDNRNALK